MARLHEKNRQNKWNGIYEIKIKEAKNFDCYKYKIITKDDRIIFKLIPMQDILKNKT